MATERLACRNWIGGDWGGDHCNKPARYIVWGKLNPPENLGPRCEDCLLDQQPGLRLYQLDQYAIYELPQPQPLQGDGEAGERVALLLKGSRGAVLLAAGPFENTDDAMRFWETDASAAYREPHVATILTPDEYRSPAQGEFRRANQEGDD